MGTHASATGSTHLVITDRVRRHSSKLSTALMRCDAERVLALLNSCPDGWDAKSLVRLGLEGNQDVGANHSHLFALYQYARKVDNANFDFEAPNEALPGIVAQPDSPYGHIKDLIETVLSAPGLNLTYEDLMAMSLSPMGLSLEDAYVHEGFMAVGASASLEMFRFGVLMGEAQLGVEQCLNLGPAAIRLENCVNRAPRDSAATPLAYLLAQIMKSEYTTKTPEDQHSNFHSDRVRRQMKVLNWMLEANAPGDIHGGWTFDVDAAARLKASGTEADIACPPGIKNDLLAILVARPWSSFGPEFCAVFRDLADRFLGLGKIDPNAPIRLYGGALPLEAALNAANVSAVAFLLDAGVDIAPGLARYLAGPYCGNVPSGVSTAGTPSDALRQLLESFTTSGDVLAPARASLMRRRISEQLPARTSSDTPTPPGSRRGQLAL